jgi:hypothetical protein
MFTGCFDGRGNTIANLTSTENGLFGYMYGASVKDLHLLSVKIKSTSVIGGLAGTNNGAYNVGGNISSVEVTGSVNATDLFSWAGGLVGQCYYTNIISIIGYPSIVCI